MPQLEISTFPSQIFWLVVSFLLLYLILSKIIVPRIASVLKDRENEIKNNFELSEKLYKKTESINQEIEEIKKQTELESNIFFNGVYQVNKVESRINNGQFTQMLYCTRLNNQTGSLETPTTMPIDVYGQWQKGQKTDVTSKESKEHGHETGVVN